MTNKEHDVGTVLVVDDHRFSRTIFSRILTDVGFQVLTAADGVEALELTRSHTPEAFIVDVGMPRMDGISLCGRLRADPRFQDTPILVTTASDVSQVVRDAFAAGCDDVIHKPLEPAVVAARLSGLLQKASAYRELARIRERLARYVSPRLRHIIEADTGEETPIVPELKEIAILFSDIRGFTALSQSLAPEVLFDVIGANLSRQVDAVYRHRGYVDKFAGDGIMAVFDGPRMARDACDCALEIIAETRRHDALPDGAPMPLGIGIHAGPVVAGNIGTGEHMDYSVIGETVNLAARLCGYAGALDVVVSEDIRRSVDGDDADLDFSHRHQARLRGLHAPMTLYHLRPVAAALS
ncbi:adenylate/guanylate cyclase domain-containing response regulator [Ectothiorhodospiraceae bacterium WFHF3C12]|nr:adenylate/guanylate cyclase domain-containing response regulator [Ectothiorhodospiraceae bacterium WFHF3C12]